MSPPRGGGAVPELRSDKLTDTWVVLAEERRGRPLDNALKAEPRADKGPCPFCPGNEAATPPETFALRDAGAADSPGWRLRVVPNKFPAFAGRGAPVELGHVLRRIDGVGAHEVVVEGPWHAKPHRARTPREWADLALALQDRLRALARDGRVHYVLAFKNAGPASGASLDHPHSQLVAMPLVPERVRRELHNLEAHHRLTGRCLLEDLVQEELDAKVRVVEEDARFVLVAPFAARVPYEMLLAPRHHGPRFEDEPPEVVEAFGHRLGRALARLEGVLAGQPFESYHFALHTAPTHGRAERHHWHCEVLPSSAFHSGFEKGTGMFVNHRGPESCAERLRAVAL